MVERTLESGELKQPFELRSIPVDSRRDWLLSVKDSLKTTMYNVKKKLVNPFSKFRYYCTS